MYVKIAVDKVVVNEKLVEKLQNNRGQKVRFVIMRKEEDMVGFLVEMKTFE